MADNRKRAPRGGKQAASGSRPIRRNDRAAAPKGQRERSQAQAARPQRDRNRDAVQAPKGELIEGRRAAAEALRTGFPVKCALIAEGGERDAALSRLVDDLNAAGVSIKYVPRAQLDTLSSHGAHQGIALEVGNFPYADVADILDRVGDGPALVIVLDHVTDDGNFGAIVRSAEVVGAAGVVAYQVGTELILDQLLPAGVAVPHTRAELAMLLWNTAGRPAPATLPAFADVADPELAQAAQWAIEQGYLKARADGSFKPDKGVAKWRVIRGYRAVTEP